MVDECALSEWIKNGSQAPRVSEALQSALETLSSSGERTHCCSALVHGTEGDVPGHTPQTQKCVYSWKKKEPASDNRT